MYARLLVFATYFTLSLLIAIIIRDIPGQPHLTANITNFMDMPGVSKFGDPSSFAAGAIDIYHHGWIQPNNLWLIHLWPPGFMLLEGLILKLFGLDANFIVILSILSSLLFSIVLMTLRSIIKCSFSEPFATIIPLAPLFFPVVRLFMLQPGGVIFGESFAISFFALSLLFLVLGIKRDKIALILASGLSLALSAYFRSQFEIFVILISVGGLGLYASLTAAKKWYSLNINVQIISHTRKIATIVLVANAAMMPWRIHNFVDIQSLSWVQTQQLIFINASQSDEDLISAGGQWIVDGRGNVACKINPDYCGHADKRGFYETLVKNPIAWATLKYEILPIYWFSSLTTYASPAPEKSLLNWLANLVAALLTVVNIYWLGKWSRLPNVLPLTVFCGAFYAGNVVIFLLAHYETRYLYAAKILSILFFILLSIIKFEIRKNEFLTTVKKT